MTHTSLVEPDFQQYKYPDLKKSMPMTHREVLNPILPLIGQHLIDA
jgi:hypothetical protein